MEYVALYRKWRPRSFDSLVGQEHVSRTLSQAIQTGRVGHAYLFSGPRGTGKTSTAKILAKALNCEHGPTPSPCDTCLNCQKINDGSSMDVMEIDAASNRGIDEIRDLRETVKFAPVEGRYKVYIIDEVHMLTTEAFNALLKTLEEPPPHVVFILATTEPHKVPATIQSRCQRYDFKRITAGDISARLRYVAKESGIEADADALELIALQADGGMRDALSLLDQCVALSDGRITREHVQELVGLVGREWILRMAKAIAEHQAQEVLSIVAKLLRDGKELRQLLSELVLHLRGIMVYQAAGQLEGMGLYAESVETMDEQARLFPPERIPAMIQQLHEAIGDLRWSPQPRITAEVALLSLARKQETPLPQPSDVFAGAGRNREMAATSSSESEMEARIARLESMLAKVTSGIASTVPATVPPSPKVPPRASIRQSPSAAPPTAVLGAAPANAPLPTAEGNALWSRLLRTLKERDKQLQLSCFSQGSFEGMSDRQFFVHFPSPILAQLAMRNYRKGIEALLAELAGRDLELVCSHPESRPAPRPSPPKKKTEAPPVVPMGETPAIVDMEAMEPEERKRLQQAVDVFGGTFVEPPHDQKAKEK